MRNRYINIYNLLDFAKLESNQEITAGESEDTAESDEESTELQSELQTVDYTEQLNNIIAYEDKIYNAIMCLLYFTILAFIIKLLFKQIFSWLNGA